MAQIDIPSLVANSIIANLAINPQIKAILHNDMSLDDFVDTMKLWIDTPDFWRHMAEGLLSFMRIATNCKDCQQLDYHDGVVDDSDVGSHRNYSCGCVYGKKRNKKPRQVKSLRGDK